MLRQIALDTETTGISHKLGHRVIEIGCIELFDRQITGQSFHAYLNPEREVDLGAFKVHGLSNHFLDSQPLFVDVVDDFLKFIGQSELIIHNAPFDLGFLNAELKLARSKKRIEDRCSVIDTLVLAKKMHPGERASLDALCKRYFVDNSKRALHGALLDAKILAYVYLAMTGGQHSLFVKEQSKAVLMSESADHPPLKTNTPVLLCSPDEFLAHSKMIELIAKKSGLNLW